MFMFLFLFFSMLLLCSFFRLKELFQVRNGVSTSLLFIFFLENAKNLGRSGDGKRRKKRGWPKRSEMAVSWTTTFSQLSLSWAHRARDWGENPGPRSARLKLNSRNSRLTRTRFCTLSHSYSAKTANIICLCRFKVTERNEASLRKDLTNKNLTEMTFQRCKDVEERRRNIIS